MTAARVEHPVPVDRTKPLDYTIEIIRRHRVTQVHRVVHRLEYVETIPAPIDVGSVEGRYGVRE